MAAMERDEVMKLVQDHLVAELEVSAGSDQARDAVPRGPGCRLA